MVRQSTPIICPFNTVIQISRLNPQSRWPPSLPNVILRATSRRRRRRESSATRSIPMLTTNQRLSLCLSDLVHHLVDTNLTFNSEMSPPITVSITRVRPDRWNLGSSIICEMIKIRDAKPADAIIHWQDSGNTFCLRKITGTTNDLSVGDAEIDRIHVGGTSAAVWCIGENAFCKVHAWCEGLEPEVNTIQSVKRMAPKVPVPEVIYSWIDHDLKRTFLITKRVRGRTLEQAWPQLSSAHRTQIAHDIAQICVTLAANTSSRFETVNGCGVYEARLMENAHPSHPTWLPRILGPFSREAFQAHMAKISPEIPPDSGNVFHFNHADLGPTNIIISEDSYTVAGVIDWESAAYYPRFWVATKPMYAGAFWLECETDGRKKLWGQLLGQALDARGYKQDVTAFRRWRQFVT